MFILIGAREEHSSPCLILRLIFRVVMKYAAEVE
jgi:hypothetical protein